MTAKRGLGRRSYLTKLALRPRTAMQAAVWEMKDRRGRRGSRMPRRASRGTLAEVAMQVRKQQMVLLTASTTSKLENCDFLVLVLLEQRTYPAEKGKTKGNKK